MSSKKDNCVFSKEEINMLFENEKCEDVAKDIQRCLTVTLEQIDSKYADVFSSLLSLKLACSRDDSDFERIKNYCSFIVCVSLAVLNVSPFIEIVGKGLRETTDLGSNSSLAFFFRNIISNMFFGNTRTTLEMQKIPEKNFKLYFLKDMIEIHHKINLRTHYKDRTQYLEAFDSGLQEILSRMKVLASLKKKFFVEKSKSAERFVYYLFDLYREFQLKTWIEYEDEEDVFALLLKALQSTCFLLKFNRAEIVSKLIKYWPKSYAYQIKVIPVFMKLCKDLSSDEQKSLKNQLIKKFDELLLYSQSIVFEKALFESKALSVNFVGFNNCSGKNKGTYVNNLKKATERKEKILAGRTSKKNVMKIANEKQESRKRKAFETGFSQKVSKSELSSELDKTLQKSNESVSSFNKNSPLADMNSLKANSKTEDSTDMNALD